MMPGVNFQQLRDEISIEEVLRLLGCEAVSRKGDHWRGPCPVHRSRTTDSRVFSANVKTNRYYCHKCRSHGNQLELWAAVQHMNIYDAVDLCEKLGRKVTRIHRG